MTSSALHPPSAPNDLDGALERIRASGGRVTASKRAVAELLFATRTPLTAEEIATEVADVDRSVVYRCLGQFEELGIAEHVHLGHGRAVYRRRGLPTVPVACHGCGAAVELDVGEVDAFVGRVRAATGIWLDLVHFPLSGRCESCLAGMEAGAGT